MPDVDPAVVPGSVVPGNVVPGNVVKPMPLNKLNGNELSLGYLYHYGYGN